MTAALREYIHTYGEADKTVWLWVPKTRSQWASSENSVRELTVVNKRGIKPLISKLASNCSELAFGNSNCGFRHFYRIPSDLLFGTASARELNVCPDIKTRWDETERHIGTFSSSTSYKN